MRLPRLIATVVLSVGLLVLPARAVATGQALLRQLLLAEKKPDTQFMTPLAAIKRLFTEEQIQADWFAPTFLATVPASQVQQIVTSLQTGLGTYKGVQESGQDYLVIFERGSVLTKIVLDAGGRIAGLLFGPPRSLSINLNQATEQFKALPGRVSFVVVEGKSERVALNATTPLVVGSAFKLAILDVLKSQVASGKRSWHDVVELQPSWKSLPSGFLQNWPDGSLLTVQTLAALMISQSDNTATDSLIHLVGRQAIEAVTPRNRPFLTTRQAFILKSAKNSELLKRYRAGNEAERLAVLNDLDKHPLPDTSDFGPNPTALDVEWFFTAQELCALISRVADLPLMSINPGVANAKDWERVAFKGGSEPGVLNLTTWLKARNGKSYCVAATWNSNTSLEEARFMTLYSAVIEGLK